MILTIYSVAGWQIPGRTPHRWGQYSLQLPYLQYSKRKRFPFNRHPYFALRPFVTVTLRSSPDPKTIPEPCRKRINRTPETTTFEASAPRTCHSDRPTGAEEPAVASKSRFHKCGMPHPSQVVRGRCDLRPDAWVPHPSSAWMGKQDPTSAVTIQPSSRTRGAPSKLRLDGKARSDQRRDNSDLVTNRGAPSKLRLGWKARFRCTFSEVKVLGSLSPRTCHSDRPTGAEEPAVASKARFYKCGVPHPIAGCARSLRSTAGCLGAPSKLRLGGKSTIPTRALDSGASPGWPTAVTDELLPVGPPHTRDHLLGLC